MALQRISDHEYEIPRSGAMRVPGRIVVSEKLAARQILDTFGSSAEGAEGLRPRC